MLVMHEVTLTGPATVVQQKMAADVARLMAEVAHVRSLLRTQTARADQAEWAVGLAEGLLGLAQDKIEEQSQAIDYLNEVIEGAGKELHAKDEEVQSLSADVERLKERNANQAQTIGHYLTKEFNSAFVAKIHEMTDWHILHGMGRALKPGPVYPALPIGDPTTI